MPSLYKLMPGGNTVLRSSDNAFVPLSHPDYVAWLAGPNTPDPADPPPPPPFKFDFGADEPDPDPSQLAAGVANLRAYLGLASPTLPQSTAALKLVIRMVLFLARRVGT